MIEINLNGMKFYAHHGVLEQEQVVGNNFEVNLSLLMNNDDSILSDNLDDTINYAEVYQLVKEEMTIKSKLLEHLAGRIANRILSEFQTVSSITIEVKKLAPPFHCDLNYVSIKFSKNRVENS